MRKMRAGGFIPLEKVSRHIYVPQYIQIISIE